MRPVTRASSGGWRTPITSYWVPGPLRTLTAEVARTLMAPAGRGVGVAVTVRDGGEEGGSVPGWGDDGAVAVGTALTTTVGRAAAERTVPVSRSPR